MCAQRVFDVCCTARLTYTRQRDVYRGIVRTGIYKRTTVTVTVATVPSLLKRTSGLRHTEGLPSRFRQITGAGISTARWRRLARFRARAGAGLVTCLVSELPSANIKM